MLFCLILAFIIYGAMGKHWTRVDKGRGDSLDEILWWVFCAFHGLSFGDLTPVGPFDRAMGCLIAFLGYHFVILAMSIVLLS